MIYRYTCENCVIEYDVHQTIHENHIYTCPRCGKNCIREYTIPSVKKNEGFYSDMLGEWVGSHSEYTEKLDQCRYMNDMCEYLGDSRTPKDEWQEARHKKEQKRIKKHKERLEVIERYEDSPKEENKKVG